MTERHADKSRASGIVRLASSRPLRASTAESASPRLSSFRFLRRARDYPQRDDHLWTLSVPIARDGMPLYEINKNERNERREGREKKRRPI